MRIHTLSPGAGAKRKRKLLGRGTGSGLGKTAGRGHKGQRARSGGKSHIPGFEGGQNPIHRRLPKRGFRNIHRIEFTPVNLDRLNGVEGVSEFTPGVLAQLGITGKSDKIKILGTGDITRSITITAHKFSKTAKDKIEAAGGKVTEI